MVLTTASFVHGMVLCKQLMKGLYTTAVDALESHRGLRRSGGESTEFRVRLESSPLAVIETFR